MHNFLFQSYFAGTIIRLVQIVVEVYLLWATADSDMSSINLYRMLFVWHLVLAVTQLPVRVPIYMRLKRMANVADGDQLSESLIHLTTTRMWKIHASLGFLLYLKSMIGICLFFVRFPSDWNTSVFHIMVSETIVEMGRYITTYYKLRKITMIDAPDPFEQYVVMKGALVDEISEYTQLRQFGHLDEEERKVCLSGGCPICFGEYEDTHMVRRLVCHHVYHSECIEEWLKKKKVCPKCQHPINQTYNSGGSSSSSSSSSATDPNANSNSNSTINPATTTATTNDNSSSSNSNRNTNVTTSLSTIITRESNSNIVERKQHPYSSSSSSSSSSPLTSSSSSSSSSSSCTCPTLSCTGTCDNEQRETSINNVTTQLFKSGDENIGGGAGKVGVIDPYSSLLCTNNSSNSNNRIAALSSYSSLYTNTPIRSAISSTTGTQSTPGDDEGDDGNSLIITSSTSPSSSSSIRRRMLPNDGNTSGK